MERLARRDLEALLPYLREIYACSDLEGFASCVVSTLPKVVPSDSVSYAEIDLRSRKTIAVVVDPPMSDDLPEAEKVFERHIHEQPLVNHQKTGDGRALKISDFLTRSQWHNLALYNEFYKEIRGIEHQMAIALPATAPLLNGVALSRSGKDFSERDRLLLDLLRPHLMQVHQNAKALARSQHDEPPERAVEGSERGIVVLSGKDRVQWCNEQARRWMGEYFEPARRVDRLPESLSRWVEHQRSPPSGGSSVPPPREPLIVKQAGKHLVVRLVADDPEEGSHRLVLEERYAPLSVGSLEALGLTGREAEILLHIAWGKTNKEIAATLCLSPLTVKKHLEHVYRKFGVESRTEALSRALQLLNLLG